MKKYDWYNAVGEWPEVASEAGDMVNMIDGDYMVFRLDQAGMTQDEVYERLTKVSSTYVGRVWLVERDGVTPNPRSNPSVSKSAWRWLLDYSRELRAACVMEFVSKGDRTPRQQLRDWGAPES